MDSGANLPITFLGLADHIDVPGQPFPVGSADIFRLSQHKTHVIYPAATKECELVFAIGPSFFQTLESAKLSLRVLDEEGTDLCSVNLEPIPAGPHNDFKSREDTLPMRLILAGDASSLLYFKLNTLVAYPGRYEVQVGIDGRYEKIGEIHFHYEPAPSLTLDEIKALESDPLSIKLIRIDLGCDHCATALKAYAGLRRDPEWEKSGCIWQDDLGDQFTCQCGKFRFPLKYLKESLHALLRKRECSPATSGLSFTRMYAHSQIIEIFNEFCSLIDSDDDEQVVQRYIESHPMLLAQFGAQRLYVKPGILGKYQADFAVLDARKRLVLLEIERPSLPLFKKDGHPTAKLMHAYGQVRDWLGEYHKHGSAVLDGFGLTPERVSTVKGAVIAGRSKHCDWVPLQRHQSAPPYADCEFLTFDDLARTLLEISRSLA